MLIYIIHPEKIYTFRLSNQSAGKYILFDYDSYNNKRNLVNVEVRDGKWYILDNSNVKISYNGKRVQSVELALYQFYELTVLETERINLYILPAYDTSFVITELVADCSVVCGSESGNDIVYNLGISPKQLQLDYRNGQYVFQNLDAKFPIYVNRIRKDSGTLKNFDTVFVMGLRIIICGNKLLINNPNSLVYLFGAEKFKAATDQFITNDYQTDVRTYADLYDEADYYFKSPVFKSQLKELDVTISEPPSRAEKDKNSVLITIIPTMLMTLSSFYMTFTSIKSYRKGETSKEELIGSLIICVGLIVASILWPFVEKFYNNALVAASNIKRNKNYSKYLKEKDELFKRAISEQKMTLITNNASVTECQNIINNRMPELFSRDIDGEDFLNIRLGIGDVKLKCKIDYIKPDYTPEKDKLLDDIDHLIEENKYISDAPFVISLKKNNIIAFILQHRNLYDDYMMGILLQLITYHSYFDLKLVVLTSNNLSEISFLKDSNHCWNNDKTFRYFASDLEDAQKISSVLERELNARKSLKKESASIPAPYYLIVTDAVDQYRSLNIINDILNEDEPLGFGLLMYDMKISNIPNDCINFVNISQEVGSIFQTNVGKDEISKFIPEFNHNINVDYYSRLISNIPLKSVGDEALSLPEHIGFLQMYHVGNIEQLNSSLRWDNSSTTNSLSAPIGVDTYGNNISLDLHEKNHGPHGLIAGMTGSGKSEFIITFILSLAVNYRPDEVQFVLIDYKGGGLAGAFENRKTGMKLPHLVGTITNLDESEMNRTLVSIRSELQRRQKLFNEAKESLDAGNIDIYKYQKLHRDGVLSEPLSHLFIICDEFAELKVQQPDFMDELVSAARIGRSLGIHLILATQKPSGVVDEQIWSNSKFKVCCKVQTVDDSNEMIKRGDAAFLKEAGRFFLQVGYDEYFIEGQSAYTGTQYIPSETVTSKINTSISFLTNTGEVYKSVDRKKDNSLKKANDLGDELTNLLRYIIDTAARKGFKYQQLWLDNIPSKLYYANLIKKYEVSPLPFVIDPIIGEYDDPKNQKQGYVSLPLTEKGNLYIVGASGSGKSTLLSTIIYSTIINHNCEEVNFYIVDFGTEKLMKFQKAPQVGDVLTIEDRSKIHYLFYMLEAEQLKRQKYYAASGTDFLSDVREKKSPFPNIIVIINDVEVFKEEFEDLYDEKFVSFTRNCSKFGINFIVTSLSASSLGFLADNNFPQRIMLNMVDPSDYNMFFDNPPIPNKNSGRGLVQLDDVYEFQVSMIFEENSERKNLQYIVEQLDKFLIKKAKRVPVVPDEVSFDDVNVQNVLLNQVPIGINMVTAQPSFYDLTKLITLVSCARNTDFEKFFSGFLYSLSMISNTKVIVLNALKDFAFDLPEGVKSYESGFKKIFPVLSSNIRKYNEDATLTDQFLIVILGYDRLVNHMKKIKEEDSQIPDVKDLVYLAKGGDHFRFVLYDSASMFDEIKHGDVSNLIDEASGIWVGRGFDSQNCIDANDSYQETVKVTNDTVALVVDGKSEYAKFIKL